MKNAGAKHILSILILFLLTAGVLYFVVQLQDNALMSADTSVQSTVQADPSAVKPMTDSTVTESETAEETTEWLPPIVYEPYTPSEIDPQNFANTIVLGNSQAQALSNFGLLKNADFCTRIGLSVNHVLQDDSPTPPINDLNGKRYSKAVFVFGENELGWPYLQNFISHYKKVIAKVREMNPGIQIFVQAIFPVSTEASEKSTTGITNENVLIFNEALEKMCTQIDAVYMPVSQAFFDETGALPEGIAHDGVHFGYDYCKIWAGDLSAYLADSVEKSTEESIQGETTT